VVVSSSGVDLSTCDQRRDREIALGIDVRFAKGLNLVREWPKESRQWRSKTSDLDTVHKLQCGFGAGDGNRTRTNSLEVGHSCRCDLASSSVGAVSDARSSPFMAVGGSEIWHANGPNDLAELPR
jgi:hypothetical protein